MYIIHFHIHSEMKNYQVDSWIFIIYSAAFYKAITNSV